MGLISIEFVLFLAGVCVLAYLCPRRVRYIWLLVCSYAFYLYNTESITKNLPALGLMLAATLVSYLCALGIQQSKKTAFKRIFLILSLVVTLGFLAVCKYYDFFMLNRLTPGLTIILPLGISYYTLQTVSYVADVYLQKQTAERNPIRYALYVSFFPGIVTGPINRAEDMLPQYKNPPKFDYGNVAGGFFRVLWGFFKKMVIADTIGLFTLRVFRNASAQTGPVLILAALLFAYQIYADFGGCCDIAIGAARMLGFKFAENFNRPFAAKTYSLLWQRWHISLTSFLRDYVFTPLVWSRWPEKLPIIGKRLQKPPVNSSVLIIFTLSGLWHGPALGYVFWGLLNGIVMTVAKIIAKPKERLVKRIPVYRNKWVRGVFQRIFVYLLFAGCLVFFAVAMYETDISVWLGRLGTGWDNFSRLQAQLALNNLDTRAILVLLASILGVELIEKYGVSIKATVADWIRARPVLLRWPLYYVLLAALLIFGVFGQSDFIYQNF